MSSSYGAEEIIYATMLHITELLQGQYICCMNCIRASAFGWIGRDGTQIPQEYDNVLQSSHRSDLYSYASFYNLCRAYKQLAWTSGPLPPAKMIRPAALVFWNHLKGGTDEFSRALKSLTYTNTAANPIVSAIGQLLCSQVNNAAVAYRLSCAKSKGYLPTAKAFQDFQMKERYDILRRDVSRTCSFGDFARTLSKEYRHRYASILNLTNVDSLSLSETAGPSPVQQLYSRGVVTKYNRTSDKERRLTNVKKHIPITGRSAYCCLCSYSFTVRVRGKRYTKKGGSRQKQWCSICRQAICRKCWPK